MTGKETVAAETQQFHEEFEMPELRVALVTDLGPNNAGTFGPDNLDEQQKQTLIEDLVKPEYAAEPSKRWICVDGRLSQEELAAAESGVETSEADPQIGGGIAISETAATYYGELETHRPLKETAIAKTKSAIADGLEVTVHGDEGGEAGCYANKKIQDVIRFSVENADIILPTVWTMLEMADAIEDITSEDLLQLIINAASAVNNDALWNATPEEVVAAVTTAGATYIELLGVHNERTTRADMSKGAFRKAKFAIDHSKSGQFDIEAFSASFGAYADEAKRRSKLPENNRTKRDVNLQIAGVFLYNLGLTKSLKSDEMQVGVIAPVVTA